MELWELLRCQKRPASRVVPTLVAIMGSKMRCCSEYEADFEIVTPKVSTSSRLDSPAIVNDSAVRGIISLDSWDLGLERVKLYWWRIRREKRRLEQTKNEKTEISCVKTYRE